MKRKISPKRIGILLIAVVAVLYLGLWILLAQPDFRKSPTSQAEVSPAVLERHVRVLSEAFVPRNGRHLGNMKKTADYIKSHFEKLGVGTVNDQWYQVGNSRYRNVSLLIGDPVAERVVIGAHYDAYGPYPGADDNASGVAGVLELARLFADKPIAMPIEFVGYPLEEPPYFRSQAMGSFQHAEAMNRATAAKCKYMVSVEMIGYFSDEPGSQSYPSPLLRAFYPGKGDFIAVVGNTQNRGLIREFKVGMKGASEVPIYSLSGPSAIPGIDFSDHQNYWKFGFPAVMVTNTAFNRNLNYHTPGDTADRLDYQRMASVVKAIDSAVRRLAAK